MSQISPENYFVVNGWMITELKLSGNELIIFAILYGFCQCDNFTGSYHGSLQYLVDFTGTTKPTVIKALKSLAEKQLIIKSEGYQNNVKFCEYRINVGVVKNSTGGKESLIGSKESLIGGSKESLIGSKESLIGGSKESLIGSKESLIGGIKDSLPNKEYNINKNINKDNINNLSSTSVDTRKPKKKSGYEKVVDLFNSTCTALPKVRSLTDARKKAIKKATEKLGTLEEFEKLFKAVQDSDFLTGRSEKGWDGCCFDWILKPSNLVKIIEGNYDNKRSKPNKNEAQDRSYNIEEYEGYSIF